MRILLLLLVLGFSLISCDKNDGGKSDDSSNHNLPSTQPPKPTPRPLAFFIQQCENPDSEIMARGVNELKYRHESCRKTFKRLSQTTSFSLFNIDDLNLLSDFKDNIESLALATSQLLGFELIYQMKNLRQINVEYSPIAQEQYEKLLQMSHIKLIGSPKPIYNARYFNLRDRRHYLNGQLWDYYGFDIDGIHRDTGTPFNPSGFNLNGFNAAGFTKFGHRANGDIYDTKGFNAHGRDRDGRDKDGFDDQGFDRNGRDISGYNASGFNESGFNRQGFNRQRLDRDGFGEDGLDIDGYNRAGFDAIGVSRTGFTDEGYDINGYNIFGFNRDGRNALGLDYDGRDENGNQHEHLRAPGISRFGKIEKASLATQIYPGEDNTNILAKEFPSLFPHAAATTKTLESLVGSRCYLKPERRQIANFPGTSTERDLFVLNIMLECNFLENGQGFDLNQVVADFTRPTAHTQTEAIRELKREDALLRYARRFIPQNKLVSAVNFIGEGGADVGGLTNEFFSIISQQLLSYDFFTKASTDAHFSLNTHFENSRADAIFGAHDEMFFFNLGKMLATVYFYEGRRNNGVPLPIHLSYYLRARMLGYDFDQTDSYQDLTTYLAVALLDGTHERNTFLNYWSILEMANVEEACFSFSHRPEGQDDVTNDNVYDYIREQMAESMNKDGKVNFFIAGFQTKAPTNLGRLVQTPADLDQLIRRSPSITDLFRPGLELIQSEGINAEMAAWIQEVITEEATADAQFLENFLAFTTGLRSLPSRAITFKRVNVDEESLPAAHTCFNTLDVPNYPSKAKFRTKLKQAIELGSGAFTFQ